MMNPARWLYPTLVAAFLLLTPTEFGVIGANEAQAQCYWCQTDCPDAPDGLGTNCRMENGVAVCGGKCEVIEARLDILGPKLYALASVLLTHVGPEPFGICPAPERASNKRLVYRNVSI